MLRHLLKILTVLLPVLSPVSGLALTPVEAFTQAPDYILPLLDKNTRLDMVDYFKAGSSHPSRNILLGDSRLVELNDRSVKAQVTEAQTIQMVILPAGSDTLVAVINTVMTPVPDSSVDIFSSSWERQGKKVFKMPDISQWLRKSAERKSVDRLLSLMLVTCDYYPPTMEFVFTNVTADYLGEEEYAPLKPLLRDYIVYGFEPGKRRITPLPSDAANPLAK